MPQDQPLVSVILPCLGAPNAAERSLARLRAQTCRRFEILLMGSTDAKGARWSALFEEGCLRSVPATMGLANAWNASLAQSAGRCVCFLEAGDELDPTYLEKCLFLMETLSFDLCASWRRVSGESWETGPFSVEHLRARDVSAPAAVIRKACLSRGAPFDVAVPEQLQTRDLWIRLARSPTFGHIIPEALVEHPGWNPSQEELLFPGFAGVQDGGNGRERIVSHDKVPRVALTRLFGTAEQSPGPAILLAMPYLAMGGAETIVSQLCRHLQPLGFRIFLITTMPAPENHGDTTGWFVEHTAGIYHLPCFLDASLWPAFIFYLIHYHSIRVIWLVGSSFTYDLLGIVKRLFKDIAVVDLLFNPVGHSASLFKHNHLIDHIVTEYEGLKSWLTKHGADEKKVSVIPNGVDIDFYRPEPRKCWRTGAPRDESSPFVAAFMGRLSQEKAPDSFVEIAARFKNRPNFEFLLCGTGPMESELRALSHRRGLRGRIHHLGFVSAKQYLPCCDVLIVCSRLDGRPNVVMESMAMGIPVVASRTGGIAEMAPEGQGSVLCQPERVGEFCSAIETLASDRKAYRQLSSAARRRAETHFSLAGAGRRYAALFHQLIGTKAPFSRPVRLEDIFAAAGLDLRPIHAGPVSAWLRFVSGLVSPKHALGNLRTVLLYTRLRRSKDADPDFRRYFDAGYYAGRYPDAAALGIPLLWHYMLCGFWERRQPSLFFDTAYYLSVHRDVAAAGVNPLIHYISCGRSEGRACHAKAPQPDNGAAGKPKRTEWT